MHLEEDKLTRIRQNLLLCEYYQQKGQFPQKYLDELRKLANQSMNVTLEPAPKCQISADGTQIMLGDWTNAHGGGANDPRKNNLTPLNKVTSSGGNNALSSAISSGLGGGAGGSAIKSNLSAEEVFLNSVKLGVSASQQATASPPAFATASAPTALTNQQQPETSDGNQSDATSFNASGASSAT